MPEFSVRSANMRDVDAVLALERACTDAPHWSAEVYTNLAVLDPESIIRRVFLVAVCAGRVVGFVVANCLNRQAELESVAVAVSMRRKGVARALIAAVTDWAMAHSADVLQLEVRSANGGARRLYEELGFTECGRRARYYAEPEDDAVLMCWTPCGKKCE